MGKQEYRHVLGALTRLTTPPVDRWRPRPGLLILGLLALLGLFDPLLVTAEGQVLSAANSPGALILPATVQGSWQVIQLPLNWRRKYLKEPRPRELAVALLSPTAADIGADNAPCGPPQSVVLIATSDSGRTRTKLLHKGEYCSGHWHPPANLSWAVGPRIAIEAIAVAIEPNGGLEIIYTMRREVGHSDDPTANTEQHGTWKDTLPLERVQSFLEAPSG